MPKRFTDTDKWKKQFLRGLQGAYKLLWLYILDDCDHAGIWQVDFEVARIRIGEQVDKQTAINIFADRIQVFNNGTKWFIRDFIEFQYGDLSEKNRMHLSVIQILKKNGLSPINSPLQGVKDMDKDKDKDKVKDKVKWGVGEIETALDEIFLDQIRPLYSHLDFDKELEAFRIKVKTCPDDYRSHDTNGLRKAFQFQLRNAKKSTFEQKKKSFELKDLK